MDDVLFFFRACMCIRIVYDAAYALTRWQNIYGVLHMFQRNNVMTFDVCASG